MAFFVALVLAGGCSRDTAEDANDKGFAASDRVVTLYTSQDARFLEDFFIGFEADSKISVQILGDSEAAKTVGLAQRLIAEREHPLADVFWNNEFAQTVRLVREGVLEPEYALIAARARVVVAHKERLGARPAPRTWDELAGGDWRDELVIARPLAGTTLSHFAALVAARGEERAAAIMRALRGATIAESNGQVMRLIRDGRATVGITDSDDLAVVLRELRDLGQPDTAAAILSFAPEGDLAFYIPSTVALVKGAPHREAAQALIAHLKAPATIASLIASDSMQFTIAEATAHAPMDSATLEQIAMALERTARLLETELLSR